MFTYDFTYIKMFTTLFMYICFLVIAYSVSLIDYSKPLTTDSNLQKIKNIQNSILAATILFTLPSIILLLGMIVYPPY